AVDSPARQHDLADKDGAQPLEPDLRTVSSVEADASQLYGLVPFLLAPEAQLRDGPLAGDAALKAALGTLPHQAAYREWAENLVGSHPTGGPSLEDLGKGVADGIVGSPVTRQGADVWFRRRDAFRRWMRTYRRARQDIQSAHLAALFLLGGDDAELMDDRITAGGASGRDRLREEILSRLTGLDQGLDPAELPLVMLREPAVQELIDHPEQRSAARLHEVADALATDDLVRELAQHAEMATRAATILPEAEGPVWWYEWEEGPARRSHAYAAGGRTFTRPRRFQAKSSIDAVLRAALEKAPRHAAAHLVVRKVEKPRQAHPYAPFARFPDDQVVYPRASTFKVKDRDIVRDLATGLEYALVSLEEVVLPAERRWQEPIITREVRTPGGILFGEASYAGSDWTVRSDVFPRLLDMRPGTVYVPPDFGQRRPLPVPLTIGLRQPGDKPQFTIWASHGRAGFLTVLTPEGRKFVTGTPIGRRSAELVRRLGLGRGTRQLVFTCYSAYGPDGLPSVAQKFVDEHADGVKTVGSTSLSAAHTVNDPDPQAEIYLTEKDTEPPPAWQVFQPRAGVGPGEQTARLPLAGQGDRYRNRYGTPQWEQAARAHEKAIGEAFDKAADVENFATQLADALTAGGYQVNIPGNTPSVSDVMEAISEAARRVHGDKEFTLVHDDNTGAALRTVRGLLLRTGPFPSMQPVFHAYAAGGFSGADRWLLKTLIGWRLSKGTHTLAEVLGEYAEAPLAQDGEGINLDRLRDVLLGDAVDLYAWVRSELSPFAGFDLEDLIAAHGYTWEPPHHQLYLPGLASQTAGGVEVPEGLREAILLLENADDLPPIADGDEDYLGGGSWAARHAALRDWSARHSGSPLDGLLSAHLTALYVATHDPDHRLLRAQFEAESGAAAAGQDRLADGIRATIDEAMSSGSLDFPYLLSEDPQFEELATEAAGITDRADERFGEILAEMTGMAQPLADVVRETVGETLGILAEALAELPEAGAPVYIGYLAGGELTGHPSGTLHSLVIPQYYQGGLDRAAVFDKLDGTTPGQHRVLVRVEGSPARDLSFSAGKPQSRQVMFPWSTEAHFTAHGVMYDADGEPYEYMVAQYGQRPEPMEIGSGPDTSGTGPDEHAFNALAVSVRSQAAEPSAADPSAAGTGPAPAHPDARFRNAGTEASPPPRG
ncbi:hypothetical protein ABZ646_42925, partial [Streptomyces sp. NPDC007162]|uniref:hypothetical protein n=1 Tax=Streptomyces sp. NPDC007162 TaxID=3156917 RepID=UPI0033CCFB17